MPNNINYGLWYDFRNPKEWEQPFGQFYKERLDQIVQAEELGFKSCWLTEHHFTGYNTYSDPIILASAISQIAPSLNIGFSVNVVPFHHPVRFATQMNLLDQLIKKRID